MTRKQLIRHIEQTKEDINYLEMQLMPLIGGLGEDEDLEVNLKSEIDYLEGKLEEARKVLQEFQQELDQSH